ncbi:hypothetical protein C8F04DRAFT_415495 [Mycena alexandri]|uniref:Uncharacterized protein n=1 Tax=Mycena alexandri TaxID=1745969 RepID=A0AAD6S0Z4_9AGAR|nr:hypothetical protein C8F04DRAFT_491487 [Mycena alexandri]KAJ7017905.1 hypothetical protein C8F04DRAFT_415495 [Mycena alexandri]
MSAPAKATTSQPQATEMNVMNVAAAPAKQGVCKQGDQCEHDHKHKNSLVSRMRGGGAGKDCLLGMLGCFLCFECCEGCCECIADIVCCPCEMCC